MKMSHVSLCLALLAAVLFAGQWHRAWYHRSRVRCPCVVSTPSFISPCSILLPQALHASPWLLATSTTYDITADVAVEAVATGRT